MKRTRTAETERANPRTRRLDRMTTRQILAAMNDEDACVAGAVRRELRQIARAADAIADSLAKGGRLFYVGAGTSGRLGVLDASEIPPTFQFPPGRVRGLIAGGNKALRRSVEGAEDSEAAGAKDIRKHKVRRGDVVVGLAASGSTPYVLGAARQARKSGATTIGITCNPKAALLRRVKIGICPRTGPEVIAGSTRLKAGTAQKLVLNMLSTAAMARLGHVYRNLMVNVQMSNAKLRQRGLRILREATGCTEKRARRLVRVSGGSLKTAIVMERAGVNRSQAEALLREASGHTGRALGEK